MGVGTIIKNVKSQGVNGVEDLKERVAYLQGLMDGFQIRDDTEQGRILREITKVLGAVADHMTVLSVQQQEMEEYLAVLDEDLADLEEGFFAEEDFFDDSIDIACPTCGELVSVDGRIMNDAEAAVEIVCPGCGDIVFTPGDELVADEDLEEMED